MVKRQSIESLAQRQLEETLRKIKELENQQIMQVNITNAWKHNLTKVVVMSEKRRGG